MEVTSRTLAYTQVVSINQHSPNRVEGELTESRHKSILKENTIIKYAINNRK